MNLTKNGPVEDHNLQIFWTSYGQQREKITKSPSFAAGNLARTTYHAPQPVIARSSCYASINTVNGLLGSGAPQKDGTGFQI